jgi:IS4 transposase
MIDSPYDAARHPYHAALRILSFALHNLARMRQDLEEDRRLLREKEIARRKRAAQLLNELQSSEQETAKRVLQSLFPDDDEHAHQIQKRQSTMVSYQSVHPDLTCS